MGRPVEPPGIFTRRFLLIYINKFQLHNFSRPVTDMNHLSSMVFFEQNDESDDETSVKSSVQSLPTRWHIDTATSNIATNIRGQNYSVLLIKKTKTHRSRVLVPLSRSNLRKKSLPFFDSQSFGLSFKTMFTQFTVHSPDEA